MDRRVARTRRALQEALLALMLRKGYEAVTVEDICAEADVGRSTFYAHFTGKHDLKRSGFDDRLRAMLIERQREAKAVGAGKGESFAFALALFEHAREHLDIYRALVAKGGVATTLEMIRRMPREAVTQYVVGAFMALLTWWLDSGAKLPPERVDALFRSLATRGLARACA